MARHFVPFLYFLLLFFGKTQAGEIKFKHLTINDGLSQNAVTAIYQDRQGFMWFGTKDGLNRYDGYEFLTYYHNPFDSTTISGNNITSIMEDSRGYIWVGTLSEGLNCFRPEEKIFHHIQLQNQRNEFPEYFEIRSIVEDASGNIFIGTWGDGIYKLDVNKIFEEKEKGNRCLAVKLPMQEIDYSRVFNIVLDSDNVLWISSEAGLYEYHDKEGTLVHHPINCLMEKGKFDTLAPEINTVFVGKDHDLWLGTNYGLVKYNPKNSSNTLYPHRNSNEKFKKGKITAITSDISGLLWLATPSGLIIFDPSDASYQYYTNDHFDPNSISYDLVSSLFADKTGIVWVGTLGMGLNKYDPYSEKFSSLERPSKLKTRVNGFSLQSILEDNEGSIWFSSEVLYRWNRKTGEIKSFETRIEQPDDFGNTSVWSMIQASDGIIWTCTDYGLFRYDPKTRKARQFAYNENNPQGIPEKVVSSVLESRDGSIWITTQHYLSRLTNSEKGIFYHYQYPTGPQINRQPRVVMYEDQDGILWLGTIFGLIRFETNEGSFTVYRQNPNDTSSLNNNVIKSICPDPSAPNEYLWIGTEGGGLNLLNKSGRTFSHITTNDGLPNDVIYSILPDEDGNLWISTNRGISKFNPKLKTFRNYDQKDGLQSNEFNTGAYFLSRSGEIFLGGINGLSYFFPQKIKDNPHKPQVVFTKIDVRSKDNVVWKSADISFDPGDSKIILSHKEKYISFEFSALSFSSPLKNQYAYMLENFHNQWIYTGTGRSASFTHLPPGKYIFHVKSSNSDGVWNEEGTSVKLTIKPPWYQTPLAYLIFLWGIVVALFFLRKFEIKRLDLKNQLILEKVKSDSLHQLDQTKSNFFANISHEFRTPLSLILGNSNLLRKSALSEEELSRIQKIENNANMLLHLINQLLELSKIEEGKLNLNTGVHNMVSFLKNLFYSFEPVSFSRKIRQKFECQDDIIPVRFDAEKMERIFHNLLSNAFKFTREYGEVKLSIGYTEEKLVKISVIDNGIGIPKDRLPKIFDRFYQVDDTGINSSQGSGIGLSLAKELVELHGGRIVIESNEGAGTECIVTFPVSTSAEIEDTEVFSYMPIAGNSTSETGNDAKSILKKQNKAVLTEESKKILLVEDNADVRDYLREILESEYLIFEGKDGDQGLTIAQNELPDLIITDLMMPKVDGQLLCKLLKEDERTGHIPIIMLTARAGMEAKIENLQAGIDDFLIKPFNEGELRARVKNLITQRENLRKRFSTSTIIKPTEVTAIPVDKAFLDKVIQIIESHFEDDQFSVESLAAEVNMSVSQINRKLNALIDQPAGHLIRSLKLQRAADLLRQNAGTVSEICYRLAFNDQAYFSRAFKKQFGTSPREFKEQFRHKNSGQH